METGKKYKAAFTFKPGGSLKITGDFIIKDHQGRIIPSGDSIKLCRCGKTKEQPFCDNTHRTK